MSQPEIAPNGNQTQVRSKYDQLRHTLLVQRYDKAGRILVLVMFIGSLYMLVTAPWNPQNISELKEWTLGVCSLLATGVVGAILAALQVAKILIEEIDDVRRRICSTENQSHGDQLEH